MTRVTAASGVFLIYGLLIFTGPGASAQGKGINIANFIETTERSYLFLYPSEESGIQTGDKKRISITTQCQRPASAGPGAKKCIHEVEIQPGNSRFRLNTGEEVVMIDLPGEDDPLLLGTVEYGQGDGPDVIRLYSEKGKYLGSTVGIDLVVMPDQAKILVQPYSLKNAVLDDGKYYIILAKDDGEGEFETLVMKKGAEPQKVPFSISIPDKGKCGCWYIDEFMKKGEGMSDLAVKLKGTSCSGEKDTVEKYLRCSMAR